MSETRFHGARVTENTDLVTAINDVDSSVIGIVATADDADAKLFPLNKPTLLTRVNDVLGKCGTTGTLYRALKAIADQVSTKVIVVRVAEHKEEDGKTQDQLVIGGSESDGSYTGMYALLVAEQDESIGYRPRILAAPELDTEAVTKSLCVIAGKLRAFVYASCHGCNTMAEVITYRQKFNEREVMLLWPDFIAYNPKSGKNETFPAPAYACGLRAYIDHEQGWHKSLSNVPVKNVLGMSRHVFWSLQAEDSDANSLNNKEITTIIRRNGFRFWGNRTPETNAYIFEVYNGLRGSDAGTAMRASLSRLASPPKAAADALKELGVSVADARGKMRPMEDVLLDLYKATQKYGQVDQVSFFKDIAGEEAFVGLQTLVAAAGSGELQKLTRELQGARGEADRVAKVMADNLDGDLKNLDSAWEGLRIRISDLVDGPLRSVTQWLTRVLEKITSLAQAHPVLTRQLLIAGGALLAMTATIGSLSLVIGVLYGKLATLRLGFDILTRSMNVIRVLPALWGMVTGSVSLLGGAIGALFSPVSLIVAALAGAAVLIWKYWDPIRAFFAGVFSGIMERLNPLRETFERFGPVFDAIGSGISQVFNWFKSLLSPMESSKETLDKCTSAGEIFGNVLGGALQLVLTPAKMLLDTLAWILEKLGVLPDEAERARKKIEDAQRAAILQDKVALLQGDLAKINPPKPVENGNGTGGDKPKDNKPLTDSNTGTLRRLSKIADNTGKLVEETKKRIGPGDIVFKNLPRALAVRGEWQERKIAQASKPAPAINITPVVPAPLPPALVPAVAASSRPVAEAIRSPVASVPVTSRNREPVASGFGGEIHVHLHNVVTQNPRELAKLVGEMVRAEMERRARAGRGSFYDKD